MHPHATLLIDDCMKSGTRPTDVIVPIVTSLIIAVIGGGFSFLELR